MNDKRILARKLIFSEEDVPDLVVGFYRIMFEYIFWGLLN